MMTGSEGVSFLLPQLFFSQQRLSGQLKKQKRQKKSKKLIKKEEVSFVRTVHIHYNPDYCALQSAKTQDHTKDA